MNTSQILINRYSIKGFKTAFGCAALLTAALIHGQNPQAAYPPGFTESQRKAFMAVTDRWTEENVAALLEKAYANDQDARLTLCAVYSREGNWYEAVRWCRRVADAGHPLAQDLLGQLYMRGRGVAPDMNEGLRWTRMAAEQGYAEAEASLARYYSDGWGVKRDDKLAVKWAQKAAQQGNAGGENLLGWSYMDGKGVKRNDREGLHWFQLAAQQGLIRGQLNMAWAYEHGRGVKSDREEAIRWSENAASMGSAFAAYRVADLYYSRGSFDHHRDYVTSYAWCLIGDTLRTRHGMSALSPEQYWEVVGEGVGKKMEHILEQQINPEQKVLSGRIAAEWLKEHSYSTP